MVYTRPYLSRYLHVNLINGSEVQTPNQCKDIIQLSVIMAICNMVLDDACPARILDNDD